MQVKLKDIADIRTGYPFRKAIKPVRNGRFSVIQIKDVNRDGKILYNNLARLNLDDLTPDHLVERGDILFIARGNRSQAAAIENVVENTIFGLQFFVLKLRNIRRELPLSSQEIEVLPEYLAWYINQQSAQKYFEMNAVGSNVKLINKPVLENLLVTIPPLDVQHNVVHLHRLSLEEERLTEQLRVKRRQLVEGVLLAMVEGKLRAQNHKVEGHKNE